MGNDYGEINIYFSLDFSLVFLVKPHDLVLFDSFICSFHLL